MHAQDRSSSSVLIRQTLLSASVAFATVVMAQTPQPGPQASPSDVTSVVDQEGNAHVSRVVPVSPILSPEAQKWSARFRPGPNGGSPSVADLRVQADATQKRTTIVAQTLYPTDLAPATIAGIPVKIVTPPHIPAAKKDRILICLHAGGFVADWGSATESIPVASLTQTKVISVLYRLSPENAFPAAVDDVIAVYKELLKTHRATDIGMYGSSAGATLTAEVTAKLKQQHVALPGALGVFSGFGDFSRSNDSLEMFGLFGLSGTSTSDNAGIGIAAYVGSTDRRDPILSPLFSDVHAFPPTLFLTSTRDLLLSGTTMLHKAFFEAGVDAELVVFEGLPHAFWAAGPRTMPEAIEANHIIAEFFDNHLGRARSPR
jgi:acetyl esterase/lipase